MTQKIVGIYEIESFKKTRTDRKGIIDKDEDSVTTTLKPDGWNPGRELVGNLDIHTLDSLCPEWGDHFIVTVEKLPPRPSNDINWAAYLNTVVAAKKQEGSASPVVGRKFR